MLIVHHNGRNGGRLPGQHDLTVVLHHIQHIPRRSSSSARDRTVTREHRRANLAMRLLTISHVERRTAACNAVLFMRLLEWHSSSSYTHGCTTSFVPTEWGARRALRQRRVEMAHELRRQRERCSTHVRRERADRERAGRGALVSAGRARTSSPHASSMPSEDTSASPMVCSRRTASSTTARGLSMERNARAMGVMRGEDLMHGSLLQLSGYAPGLCQPLREVFDVLLAAVDQR